MFQFVSRSSLPSRGLHAFVLLLLTFALPMVAQATDFVYTAGSFNQGFGVNDPRRNLNWHNEFNWEPKGIPSAGDGATVSSNFLVFIDQPVTVFNLSLPSGDGNAPDIRIPNDLTVTGTLNWSEGTIGFGDPGNLIIPAGATVNLLGPDDKTFIGVQLNSAGTINWSGTGRFAVGGSSFLNNSGLIDISAETAYFGIVANPGPVLNNSGTIRRIAGAGLFSIAGFDAARTDSLRGTLNNSGNVDVQTGTFQFHGGASSGTFNVSAEATIQCADSHRFDSNTISGAGNFRISNGSSEAKGTITRNGGPVELLGGWRGGFSDIPDSSAIYSGTGTFSWKSGAMPGIWTWATGSHIESSGDALKTYDGTLTNNGTFDWLGGGPIACNNTSFINNGTFNVGAAGLFLTDTFINGQTFDNRGTLNTFEGENRADDTGLVNSGTLNVGGGGAGILRLPSFSNSGTVNLGAGDVLSTGPIVLEATSKININIAGAAAGEFGTIKSGNFNNTINGTLTANFVNYSPPAGTTFRVLEVHRRTDSPVTFSSVIAQNLSDAKTVVPVYDDPSFVDLVVQSIAPLAVDDAYTLIFGPSDQVQQEGVALQSSGIFFIKAPGLLTNDSNPLGGNVTTRLARAPGHGRIQVRQDGSFFYLPSNGFTGIDEFLYLLDNGRGTATARVRLLVTDKRAPELRIDTPPNGANLKSVSAIRGRARDRESGIKSVTLLWKRFDGAFWNGNAWTSSATQLPTSVSGINWVYSGKLPVPGTNPTSSLLDGLYELSATATDNKGNTFTTTNQILIKNAPVASSVRLSAAAASVAQGTLVLNFTGALDAASAGNKANYRVSINGAVVPISAANYVSNSVTLGRFGLKTGDIIELQIAALRDATGKTFAGGKIRFTAR